MQFQSFNSSSQQLDSRQDCKVEKELQLFTALDQLSPKEKKTNSNDRKVLVIYWSGSMGGEQHGQEKHKLDIKKHAFSERVKQNTYLNDPNIVNLESDTFITPKSAYGRRTSFVIYENHTLENSGQTKVNDVYHLAQLIKEKYDQYFSFVIVCGVATLTYVASILSFMLENLQKTIVVTGCLIPLVYMRNDAFQNLLNSITFAGHFTIPEVIVVFGNKGFRGNRTRQVECDGFDGIESPNFPPLVTFGINVNIEWNLVLRRQYSQAMTISPAFCTEIIIIKVTPFTSFEQIKHMLETPQLKCCIFECYSFAAMPHSEDLLDLLKNSQEKKEIIVIMIQQCMRIVSEKEGFKTNYKEGVIVRYDITPESALAKAGYLIGKGYTMKQIRSMFQQNLQGEVDNALNGKKFEGKQQHILQTITEHLNKNTGDEQILKNLEFIKKYIMPNIGCHVVKLGFFSMIQELKKINANLSLGDYSDRTLLHVAVSEKQTEIVEYLIDECGVDVNAVDCQGCTPMFNALVMRNKSMVLSLKEKGGKIQAFQDDLTDLILNAAQDGDLQLLKLMYHSGIKSFNDYVNIDLRNAGHIAVCSQRIDILRFLKEHAHFDFSKPDAWNQTPLEEAILTGFIDGIKLLSLGSILNCQE